MTVLATDQGHVSSRLAPDEARVRETLERRARRLASKVEADEETDLVWLAEFSVADEPHAMRLDMLLGAAPIGEVRALPLSSPEVIGIVRWQGNVITAMSLGALLGVRGWRVDPRVLLVIDMGGGHALAVDSESIPRPVAVTLALLRSAVPVDVRRGISELIEPTRTLRLIDFARLVARP